MITKFLNLGECQISRDLAPCPKKTTNKIICNQQTNFCRDCTCKTDALDASHLMNLIFTQQGLILTELITLPRKKKKGHGPIFLQPRGTGRDHGFPSPRVSDDSPSHETVNPTFYQHEQIYFIRRTKM